MANNRIYLFNRSQKLRFCLGKYYPGTGWYNGYEDGNEFHELLCEALDRTEGNDENRWEVGYEMDDDADTWLAYEYVKVEKIKDPNSPKSLWQLFIDWLIPVRNFIARTNK